MNKKMVQYLGDKYYLAVSYERHAKKTNDIKSRAFYYHEQLFIKDLLQSMNIKFEITQDYIMIKDQYFIF